MAQQWRKGQCKARVKAQLNHLCLELLFLSSVCQESHSLCAGTWWNNVKASSILELPKSCIFQLCFSEQGICVGISLVLVSSHWPVWKLSVWITWRDVSWGNFIIAERRMFLWKWRSSTSFWFFCWRGRSEKISCFCLLAVCSQSRPGKQHVVYIFAALHHGQRKPALVAALCFCLRLLSAKKS